MLNYQPSELPLIKYSAEPLPHCQICFLVSILVTQEGQFLALKGQIEEQELKQIPNDFIINDTMN